MTASVFTLNLNIKASKADRLPAEKLRQSAVALEKRNRSRQQFSHRKIYSREEQKRKSNRTFTERVREY